MKVSKEVTDVIVEAVMANCVKKDGVHAESVKLAVRNVIHYTNKLNCDLKPDQTVYEGMNLSDMMFPSGLASLLWPRRVQLDINNRLQSNLIYSEKFENADMECKKLKVSGSGKEATTSEEDKKDYCYTDFLHDLTLIKVAMKCSELQLNTSVLQAVRDVDVLSIVDRLEFDDMVKWSGTLGSEFIPIKLVDDFNLGLVKEEYFVDTKTMLECLFNTRVKDFFTK